MKKHFQYTLLLAVVVILFSCKGNTNKTRIVKNNSSDTITVRANISGDPNYLVNINPGQETVMGVVDDEGGTGIPEEPIYFIYQMYVTKNTFDTIKKDYRDKKNWDTKIEQTKKVPSEYKHEYTFVVNNSDF